MSREVTISLWGNQGRNNMKRHHKKERKTKLNKTPENLKQRASNLAKFFQSLIL